MFCPLEKGDRDSFCLRQRKKSFHTFLFVFFQTTHIPVILSFQNLFTFSFQSVFLLKDHFHSSLWKLFFKNKINSRDIDFLVQFPSFPSSFLICRMFFQVNLHQSLRTLFFQDSYYLLL